LIDEELIRFGWEEDVWFHVDNLSSAHVYLRLQPGQSWDFIPEDLLHECCQLVKANSIEGLYLSFLFYFKILNDWLTFSFHNTTLQGAS